MGRARVSAHLFLSSSKRGHVQGYKRRSRLVAPLPPLPPSLISSIWRTKWLQFVPSPPIFLLFVLGVYVKGKGVGEEEEKDWKD